MVSLLETVLAGLHSVPVALRQKLLFWHNGAPAHYGEDIQWQLYVTYPGWWVGCSGADCTLLLEASFIIMQ